ncbi:hypothetical protein [Kitasatospora griseola]|uniref:hypothetical protein n=1 Tax=Kitasatospora griseola TaxID=2064 RepID=UPI0016705811|nr:hypothetical protein [Kitasatospora griseola]GGQ97043.1 hypothetical protein GCM10010195_61100 [Kitasatospora griseola]
MPVRESDGTHWLPRTEVQRLLALGLAASGTPSRTLHDLVDRLTAGDKADTGIGDYADLDAMAPLLARYLVRTQHCTRLLDHEADSIREHGLLLADGQGVAERLARAAGLGHLTTTQYTALKEANLITRKAGGRKGFVFLTLSGDALPPTRPSAGACGHSGAGRRSTSPGRTTRR